MVGTGTGGFFSKLSGLLSLGGGSSIGVSIGSSSIKLVELSRSGKSYKLESWIMAELPEGAVEHREIVNSIAVVETLKKMLEQVKLKSKSVCTSISGNSMMVRRLQLEVPNPKEMQDEVFWEAEQYNPFGPNDVVMDFQVLSRGKDNLTDVILIAAKRSVVDGYIATFADAGLQARIIDADFFAMENAFEANYSLPAGESAAIVDIGSAGTKIVILQDGLPVFMKDVAMGGRNLSGEIQRQMGHSLADAEALKMGDPAAVPQEVQDIMRLNNENLATEIKRAIDFYGASSGGAPVGAVYLCGGAAVVPGLTSIVEEVVGRPSQVLNPFQGISADPARFSEDFLRSIGPLAVIPIGLAIRAGAGT